GFPYFCISVALTYNDEPVWAGVYQPITKEFFYAAKGKGAFLNEKPIRVSQTDSLKKSIIAIGIPYAKTPEFKQVIKGLDRVAPVTDAIRHMGAAALDQAYVAAGRFDGVFFEQLGWWDIAAGMLLIQEAGGIVTTFEGGKVDRQWVSY